MEEPAGYMNDDGSIVMLSEDTGSSTDNFEQDIKYAIDEMFESKAFNIDRAAELKRKELYRKTNKPLHYNSDGSLETDSNLEIRAKEAVNTVSDIADWILESTENIYDFGQGEWLDNAKMNAIINGKEYSMSNKDFIAARSSSLQELIDEYNAAEENPNADKAIYTLRKFDGYNEDGTPKYIYKHGLAEVSAADRYRNQWIQDGFEIVDEKRFVGAEKWEKTLHALDESLALRTLDEGGITDKYGKTVSTDKASGINFGKGYTELYNKNLLGMDDPTKQQFEENKRISNYLMMERDKTRIPGSNWIDAIQSMATKLAIGTADTVLDILTPGGDNKLLNKYNNQEWIDKLVGYDRRESIQALTEAAEEFKQGNILGATITALSNPSVAAESLPLSIAMLLPIPGTRIAGAARIMKAIDSARKAKLPIEKIRQLENMLITEYGPKAFSTYKKYRNVPQFLKTAEYFRKNAGFYTVNATLTNDILNERIQNKIEAGEDPNINFDEILGVFATNTALLMLDRLSFKNLLGIKKAKGAEQKVIKNYLRDSFKFAESNGKKEILSTIFKKAGTIAVDAGAEAAQEYLQTWGEILGAKMGVNGRSMSDVFSDEESQDEALMGLVGGLGAGGQIAGTVQGLGLGKTLTKKTIDYINMDQDEKAIRNATKIDDILNKINNIQGSSLENVLVNEIMSNGETLKDFSINNSKNISKFIEKMINQKNPNMDNNAKKILQKEFTKNALAKAMFYAKQEAIRGNRTPLNNVLKAIKNVNEDDNINFSISDITREKVNNIAEEFSKILTEKDPRHSIKDFDLTLYNNDADYKKKIDDAIHAAEVEKIQSLINEIDNSWKEAVVSKQGAIIDFENDSTSNINDALLASESDIKDLAHLKELIQKYRDNGYVKNYKEVVDEIKKFGFIEEFYQNGVKHIRIKPSMNKYNRELYTQFINEDQIRNVLSGSAAESQGATLPALVKWSKSRWEKLLPSKATKNKPSSPSQRSLSHMFYMEKENEWFIQKAKDLKSLLSTHTVGKNGFTQSIKDEIELELENITSNIKQTKKLMKLHKEVIEDFVKNELGLDGFNSSNEEHMKIMNGILTNMVGDNISKDSFDTMILNTIVRKNGEQESGKRALQYKIHQLIQAGLKQNKNFGKKVNMIVNDKLETINVFDGKNNVDIINKAFDNLYGMYSSLKSLQNVAKTKELTEKQKVAYKNLQNAIKNIRKFLKNNSFNDAQINQTLQAMHQQKTKNTEPAMQTNNPVKKVWQKSKAKENYAETKGVVIDYKNDAGENPQLKQRKKTIINEKINDQDTLLKINNIVNDIENSAIDITNEQINNFINEVKNVLATVESINKNELSGKIDSVLKNISLSINNDIKTLHKLQDELNNNKKENKDNANDLEEEYRKSNDTGSLSGIIDSIKNKIKSIKAKIIKIGKKAFNLITNIENKKKLSSGLKNVQYSINKNSKNTDIIDELNDIQKLYNDTNKLRIIFSKISKKARENASNFFGKTLESTQEEYPEVYRLYKTIHSKLRRFKRKDGPYTYGANKASNGSILYDEYNKAKLRYEYENGRNNTKDFITYKEWLIRHKDINTKYKSNTDEDLAEIEKIANEEKNYLDNLEENNLIDVSDFELEFDLDIDIDAEMNIESSETDKEQLDKAKKQAEDSYNSIVEKNDKMNKDCK